MKKQTVTIGIPAYNEEANIGKLLKALLLQNTEGIVLRKILVISDGSTDDTAREVKRIKSKKIILIENTKREGLNPVQNQILRSTTDDVLIILNADILPFGNNFLTNLIRPFNLYSGVGIVGAEIKSVESNTLVGKILSSSHDLKRKIYQKINNGDNVYLCHGQARAFSKAFYKNLKWPYGVPEDSYSYFVCLNKGFKFIYAKDAIVNFSMSSNIADHIKQNKRFISGKKALEGIYDNKKINAAYRIPISLLILYVFTFLLKKPLLTLGYILTFLYIHTFIKNREIDHSKFEMSTSSKQLSV